MTAAAPETETADRPGVRRNDRGELVLSMEALRPKPRWLEVKDASSGDLVQLRISGNLSLDKMLELQGLERELTSAEASESSATAALQHFTELLNGLISEDNPDLPDDFRLEMGIAEATHLLIFLATPDDSIAEAFAKAITQGGAEKPDGASDDAHALAREAGLEVEKAEKAAPLRSKKRSSSRSSRSARSTTGRRSGGSSRAAPGKRSASTSGSRSASKQSAKQTD